MSQCDNTVYWPINELHSGFEAECSLEAGHTLWHEYDGIYWDKYSDNRTADMELVRAYCDAEIQKVLVELSRKELI